MVLDATVLLLIIASLGFLKSQGDLTATMEKSLYDTMAKYDPSSGNKKIRSVTGHWDNIQREVSTRIDSFIDSTFSKVPTKRDFSRS